MAEAPTDETQTQLDAFKLAQEGDRPGLETFVATRMTPLDVVTLYEKVDLLRGVLWDSIQNTHDHFLPEPVTGDYTPRHRRI